MWIDKGTVQNTVLFIIGVLVTYFVGMTSLPSSPRPSPAAPEAVSRTIVASQPAVETPSVTETPRVLTTEEIAERCEKAIAFVCGRHSFGTGFLVRPGLLATNAHILLMERIEDLHVTFPGARSESMTAVLVLDDPRRDLALLAVPTDLPALEIESAYQFRRGQDVTVIGNPGVDDKLILKNAVSRGVMSTEAMMEGQSFYQLNIAVNPGNSGGPTIDSSGKVIGVVTLKSDRLEATAFCIPAADLLSAIAQARSRSGDEEAVLAMHRARYVAVRLAMIGELFNDALSKAVTGMDVALDKRLDPNLAISQVRRAISGTRKELKAFLTSDFEKELNHAFNDVRIAESIRSELREFSNNCFAMTTTIDAPEGPADRYRPESQFSRKSTAGISSDCKPNLRWLTGSEALKFPLRAVLSGRSSQG